MALTYHILAHKNAAQIARLFRTLSHPDDFFVLHFDRRAPAALHALGRELAAKHTNVRVQPAETVVWGGPKISNLQIGAMAIALAQGAGWTHFINLTGQDFPLCSRGERIARINRRPTANYLSWFDPLKTTHWSNARERLERWHLHSAVLARLLRLPGLGRRLRAALGWGNQLPYVPGLRRRWPDFFLYFGGSNYTVLTREACRHIVSDPVANRIRRWLDHSAHADEIVFQSILHSGALAPTLVNQDWREIDFPSHSPHPRTFLRSDLERLSATENLFARKFDEQVDSEILDRLEQRVLTGS
ncbi:MAG: beta-1,6-N-acetylglucosaminyltransferase [Opitutaceae bacterium]